MKLFDDFFAPNVLSVINETVTSSQFKWEYVPGVAGNGLFMQDSEIALSDYGFASMSAARDSFITSYIESALATELYKREGTQLKNIIRMRFGLYTYVNSDESSMPHVDHDFPHQTILIYLNDSDGDTVFYDKYYDPSSGCNHFEYLKTQVYNEHTRVAPQKNKAVLFNGLLYHSASRPKVNRARYVLNINFVTENGQ